VDWCGTESQQSDSLSLCPVCAEMTDSSVGPLLPSVTADDARTRAQNARLLDAPGTDAALAL